MNELKKTRIMFVDDDPMLLASTRRQLLKKLPDCDLVFFERAADAIKDIEFAKPDIVLSDVRMPEIDGADFLSMVAAEIPDTIRLAWTGQSDADQLERVFEFAHQVFSKPCPTESLISIIKAVADHSQQRNKQRLRTDSDAESLEGLEEIDLSILQEIANFEDIFILPPGSDTV